MTRIQELLCCTTNYLSKTVSLIHSSKTTAFLILIVTFLFLVLKISTKKKKHKLPPSPSFIPILGHVHHLIGDGKTTFRAILKLLKQFGGGPTFLDLMGHKYVVVTKSRHAEILLKSTPHKSSDYKAIKALMGQGLFTCHDMSLWKYNRKIISPFFRSMKFIAHYVPVYMDESRALINKIPVGRAVNIFQILGQTTLKIICRSGLGVECTSKQCEDFLENMDTVMRVWHQRIFKPWLMINWIFKRSELSIHHDHGIKNLRDFAWQMVKERQIMGKKDLSNKTFVDAMLEEYNQKDEKEARQIVDEVITILVGGQETTATEMSFALVLMAMHPKVQDKVHQEIEQVLQSLSESEVTIEHLAELKYLDCVISETIRLYPALPLVCRELQEETDFGDYVLPKGLSVPIFIYETHRRPESWERPEEFYPERFLTRKSTEKTQFSFIPFASGIRSCIGKKYALLQMKSILCTIIRHFWVETTPELSKMEDITLEVNTTLKIYGGFNVIFQKRKQNSLINGEQKSE